MHNKLYSWIDRNILQLARELRWSYLPPLMIYLAFGTSVLTGIVGVFFVKEYLSLSAPFIATVAFWAGIPWALKMPMGHLVDIWWHFKGWLVFIGAALITSSILIMLSLLTNLTEMREIMSVDSWYLLSAVLAPLGYALQDVVADAMTVEAIPHYTENGNPYTPEQLRVMHTTMQTLGRVAVISGGSLAGIANILWFNGVEQMAIATKLATYVTIYHLALLIPFISIAGVILNFLLYQRSMQQLKRQGLNAESIRIQLGLNREKVAVDPWLLGGTLIFVLFTLSIGLSAIPYSQEIVFLGSMLIVIFLIQRLLNELEPHAQLTLLGTAIIIFVYRAMPSAGEGINWWQIDVLKFDQQFFSILSLINSSLALVGMFLLQRFMAERSITYVVIFLTLISTVLSLPLIGMYYGLHEWTAQLTGGIVDARFIAIVDTTLESPLNQIAMIPMLAWIANSAPKHLKATFFAVMASFSNLALSLSQLGTKYVNQIYLVTREVKDPITNLITTPADYSQLGHILILVITLMLILPLITIVLVRMAGLRSA